MTNILYISYDGLTDPLGQSQILPYLSGLAKESYSITIISAEKEQNYQEKREQIEKFCVSNNLKWYPIRYTKRPPILSTLLDLFKIYRLAISLNQRNPFKIIHCRSYISSLIGLRFKRKFGIKFLFDMRGFWADERIDGKIWNLSQLHYRLVYQFFKKKELEFLQEADAIVSLTHAAVHEMQTWKELQDRNIEINVIPCCVDTNRFSISNVSEEKIVDLKKSLGLDNRFVLSYLGSIGTWYMLDEMLDFFKTMLEENDNAIFFFITGESPEVIIKAATKKEIDLSKIVIQKANYTEVPMYLSLSDFSIFFIKPAYSKIASSPVKQGELMSMAIPIVCNSRVGDTAKVIEDYSCGIVLDNFNKASYRESIAKMRNFKLDKAQAIKGANEYFGLQEGVSLYSGIYKKLSR
ncbi:MAG: glycosyltransferase [Chitinophagales bacterium]